MHIPGEDSKIINLLIEHGGRAEIQTLSVSMPTFLNTAIFIAWTLFQLYSTLFMNSFSRMKQQCIWLLEQEMPLRYYQWLTNWEPALCRLYRTNYQRFVDEYNNWWNFICRTLEIRCWSEQFFWIMLTDLSIFLERMVTIARSVCSGTFWSCKSSAAM